MAKTLKSILETYAPRSEDEKRFIDKHVVVKHPDRNGNGDDVFKGKKIKVIKRAPEHGHEVGKDHEVYEEVFDEADDLTEERAKSFAFTHTPGDADSEHRLLTLKRMAKAHNTSVTDDSHKVRIIARGRLGKDNPNSEKYRKGGEVWDKRAVKKWGYDEHGQWAPKTDGSKVRGSHNDISIKDAKHHDIYVAPKSLNWSDPKSNFDDNRKSARCASQTLVAAHRALHENALNEGHFKSESVVFGDKLAARQFHTELKRKHSELVTAINDIGAGRHKVSVNNATSEHKNSMGELAKKHGATSSTLNGKWKSTSHKLPDGRWASKDVKEENTEHLTVMERYQRAINHSKKVN